MALPTWVGHMRPKLEAVMDHSDEPYMEQVSVNPQLAADLLELNTHNRKPSVSTVERYAADMANGRWRELTGETIIFDRLGRLQQGQHRLMAVVKSQVTVRFWVLFNADPDDFHVIDSGLKRTTANALSVKGASNANSIAAAARGALMLRNFGDVHWNSRALTSLTNSAVIEFYEQHLDVVSEATVQSENVRRLARVPGAQFGAVAINVMLDSHSTSQWNEFYERVLSGEMLSADSSIYVLRKWAVMRRNSSSVRTGAVQQQMKTAIITKAWNSYVLDKPMKQVYWRREEIPMPRPLPSSY